MCNVFYEVADLDTVSEDWSEKFIERICEFRVCMKQDSCRSDKQISVRTRNGSTSCGDGIGISKVSTNILDPLVAHSKGCPPFKRKQSMVEKDNGNIHGARVVELVTEENIHLHGHHHPSPSWRLDLEMEGVMHPNNFNGMLTMNDIAQDKTPTLHKDDKSEEH
ncbi:hypothetical protein HYC85_030550 [Camellia sinensis]|uniref:Uncharacterized protein n=1 Tax=Camellia sinensis TaxID=4442 RepID=A0A7J7G168_CAMSI|nr:hypothetical protein HYC85_030550 [Camellia sinensis]